MLEDLKDRGVYIQVNALSITGYCGNKEKRQAERMLDAGLIDFIGTDVHHFRHLKALEENLISERVVRKLECIENDLLHQPVMLNV